MYADDYPELRERQDDGDRRPGQGGAGRSAAPSTKGIEQLADYRKTGVTGTELFTLYDTFGFPVELSTEEARRGRHRVSDAWRAEFDAKMAEQRDRSQRASIMHPGAK